MGGSVLIPECKRKGEPVECGLYRTMNLLEHAMKMSACAFDRRLSK